MKTNIDLATEQLTLVKNILKKILPEHSTVCAFGSRTTESAKKFSDLDLLIDTVEPLSLKILAKLTASFDESCLPYKVDIVDAKTINTAFRKNIDLTKVLLWKNYE